MFRHPSRLSDFAAAPTTNQTKKDRRPGKLPKQRRAGLKRINECIEQLETRRLLTTLTSSAGIPTTFEYIDAGGKTMRIVMQGNIRAEFIAAEVPDNSSTGGTL